MPEIERQGVPEDPNAAYARTHGRPGVNPSSCSPSSFRDPAGRDPSGPFPDPPDPSPGPGFRPTNPPYSDPLIPPVPTHKTDGHRTVRGAIYLSRRSWSEFRRIQRVVEKRGLVGGSGPVVDGARRGGRPAVAEATFQQLLEAYLWKQRVCARAASPRKVDETAVRALMALYGPHPVDWLAPFSAVDRVVLQTFPTYRPPRRLHVIVNYVENGLIRPVFKLGDEWTFEDRAPPPNRVPEYRYLRGSLGYRPLDEEASLAA